MKILVSDLRPNPFRNIEHYPLDRQKIETLKASIRSTTFWDNLLVRKATDGYEIAYGHHRWQALKELKIEEIDIPVRDLDNEMMAKIMARENMEEWAHSAMIEQQTVRSIIEAYGRGEISLPRPKGNHGQIRYAPTFCPRGQNVDVVDIARNHPYTIPTLVEFLGWEEYKVTAALGGLELIESGIAEPEAFEGLSTRQSKAVTDQGKRILREAKEADPKEAARTVVRGLAKGMRPRPRGKGSRKEPAEVTVHAAKFKADEMLGRHIRRSMTKKPKEALDIDTFASETAKAYMGVFSNCEVKMAAIIKYREHLSSDSRTVLVNSLRRIVKDATKHLNQLDPDALQQTFDDMRTGGTLIGGPVLRVVR
jgi:hypothetical protein